MTQKRDRIGIVTEKKRLIALSKEEFDDLMCSDFPDIFVERHSSMSKTCMCWGFNVGPGWRIILYDLCRRIDFASKRMGIKVVATQVKEKFASLRFYWQGEARKSFLRRLWDRYLSTRPAKPSRIAYEIIESLVSSASNVSAHTCEACGEWGKTYKISGWQRTLCSEHAIKESQSKGVPLTELDQEDSAV